ncbi:MAG TPA: YidC/Oxa1 family membrane protein insertase [Verrucomicrobiae bacterium]|nr:YidC/Oxa1 family membrane protein insertase [Verrucomicrobiae bacterium]
MLEILRVLIYYPLINLLTLIIWAVPGHYAAVGIVLLTLLVRFILLIPSKKAAQTQRKMQQIAPLAAELKQEYGDDKQGFAMAQMELYKKNDINPFGNCITLLIQIPVLITLYYSIRFGLTPDNPHLYAWLPRPEFINNNFFGINLIAPDKTYVLPVLAALMQYVQARLMMPATPVAPNPDGTPDPNAMTQKIMQYFLPATTLLFALSFPAGVALYWVVSTAFQVVQQFYVNKEKYAITGVDAALKEADAEHPEHKPRSPRVMDQIKEQTSTNTKAGVTVTVRKKSK